MRTPAWLLGLACATAAATCTDSGAGPDVVRYSLRIVDGDNQTGLVGTALPAPLRVEVRESGSGVPAAGVRVDWTLSGGTGAALPETSTITDVQGVAAAVLVLGPAEGEVRVVARVQGAAGSAGFRAVAAASPTLLAPDDPVVAGSTLRLRGSGFVPGREAHRVTFSGVYGDVLEVGPNELTVRVPTCLPSRFVQVRADVEGRSSNAVALEVVASGTPVRMAVGEDLLFTAASSLRCRRIGVEAGEEYVVTAQSVSTSTAAPVSFGLLGLGPSGDPVFPVSPGVTVSSGLWSDPGPPLSVHDRIRRMERTLVAERRAEQGGESRDERRDGPVGKDALETPTKADAPPTIGDTAPFRVLDGRGGLEEVVGELRLVTAHTEVYVDVAAPAPGYSDQDLMGLASEFDAVVRPTVETAFGPASDLDGSGRITILFTPAVNRLSPRGSGTFVAGYFYAADLAPTDGADPAERFYAAVPDPQGLHADALDAAFIRDAVPAVLAHEFQHMVHFNQRILIAGAERVEALWLQEALAQLAEDLVAEELESAGQPGRAALYRRGVLDRAQRYLADLRSVSLTATSGAGTLAERGGGWLFARYVYDHLGGESLLRRMTASTRLGSETVVQSTGESWFRTFSDFTVAVFMDGLPGPLPGRFGFPTLDLRADLADVNGGYLLDPPHLSPGTWTVEDRLPPAAAAHFVLAADGHLDMALTFVGENGGRPPPESDLQVRLVRYR